MTTREDVATHCTLLGVIILAPQLPVEAALAGAGICCVVALLLLR